ncbi:MAG TPA: O-antigen ligase family protein, partial [Bacteroidia bacterium]|nr:O-antigen ligase family protein [Bacteroidia bacterium]
MPEKQFTKFLLYESLLGIALLLAAHFAEVLVAPLAFLSIVLCIVFQFQLSKEPAYAVINLAYLSASGVLNYFFAEMGLSPNFIFYGITALIVFKRLDISPIPVIYIILMLLFAFTNSFFNKYISFSSTGDSSSLLNILFPVALYIFIYSTVDTTDKIKLMYLALFGAILISSTDFLLVYLNGPLNMSDEDDITDLRTYIKVSGISNHVNQLAAFIVFIIPIVLVLLNEQVKKTKPLIVLGILLLLGLLLFMSSRAAIALTLIYFSYKILLSANVRLSLKFITVILFVVSYIAAITFELPIIKKIELKGDTGDEIRISKIDEAIEVLSENPILGIGLNNYVKYSSEHFNSSFNTHNTLLSVSTEQGLVGITIFLLIFLTPFFNYK